MTEAAIRHAKVDALVAEALEAIRAQAESARRSIGQRSRRVREELSQSNIKKRAKYERY
jgi:hypothetical protein